MATVSSEHISQKDKKYDERERERERERRYKDNLENCPRIAGIKPLYFKEGQC